MGQKLVIEINLDFVNGEKRPVQHVLRSVAEQAVGAFPEEDLRFKTEGIDGEMVHLQALGHTESRGGVLVYSARVVDGELTGEIDPAKEYHEYDTVLPIGTKKAHDH